MTRFNSITAPKNPQPGDMWSRNGTIYTRDDHQRWIAVDHEDHVIDVITDKDEASSAYDRAMSIL